MKEREQQMHFGLNCRHLRRGECPVDGRCALAILRYAGPEYSFLDTRTPVPLKLAARLLGTTENEVLRRAKAGELEWFFPDNVAKRVAIHTKVGTRRFTISEAAKRLHKSLAEIEREIAEGGIKAQYPDEFMRIVLTTRWDYEKCPLIDNGGICCDFQPHDGPQIRCLSDVPHVANGAT